MRCNIYFYYKTTFYKYEKNSTCSGVTYLTKFSWSIFISGNSGISIVKNKNLETGDQKTMINEWSSQTGDLLNYCDCMDDCANHFCIAVAMVRPITHLVQYNLHNVIINWWLHQLNEVVCVGVI